MKILYLIQRALEVSGGAALGAAGLLRNLEEKFGHECSMLTDHPRSDRAVLDTIEVIGYRDIDELKEIVDLMKPDILIGTMRGGVDAIRLRPSYGIPVILHIQDYMLCPPDQETRGSWCIPNAHGFLSKAEARTVVEKADRVFTCSQHMRQVVNAYHGRDAEVVYNIWRPEELKAVDLHSEEADYVTAICGFPHKGSNIFLDLADRFPSQKFMLVGEPCRDISLSCLKEAVRRPNITIAGRLSTMEMMARSLIVLVPSQWPEPFGRIAVEAMACQVPLLASHTGGLREIIGDSPMGIKDFRNSEAWSARLGELLESRELRISFGRMGEERARRFIGTDGAASLDSLIRDVVAKKQPAFRRSYVVTICGETTGIESGSTVNSYWCTELESRGHKIQMYAPGEPVMQDFWIHHDYLQDFLAITPPDGGKRIAVRSSDFGPIPPDWARWVNDHYDELWAHTEWIAQQARIGGVNPEKVKIVPNGVDTELFSPEGERYPLGIEGKRTFLFVGGAIQRKGMDILIQAFGDAFSADDNVCLVIKGHSMNRYYGENSMNDAILDLCRRPGAPQVILIDKHLTSKDLAALYRTCDLAVFPYRAEGFNLPVLEAMASGTPAIIPNFGACLDFCSRATSFLLPVVRIKLPVNRRFTLGSGFSHYYTSVDFCEVRPKVLRDALRKAHAIPDEDIAALAKAGVQVARERFSWTRSVDQIEKRFWALNEAGVPPRLSRRRQEREKAYKKHCVAIDLIAQNILRPGGPHVASATPFTRTSSPQRS